jgi:GNAT superfamily N-acetyltransferase
MPAVSVVRYRPELREAFARLNGWWIERYFGLEAPDMAVFADPEGQIIAPGGEIFFVLEGDRAVGTCALLPHGVGVYELAKMGVDPVVQGRGYGSLLMRAAIEWARQRGVRRLELLSNSVLTPALGLYAKHGFRHVPVEAGEGGYARANVKMVLELSRAEDPL